MTHQEVFWIVITVVVMITALGVCKWLAELCEVLQGIRIALTHVTGVLAEIGARLEK